MSRRGANGCLGAAAVAILILSFTSCAGISAARFQQPTRDWQTRTGQLMYRNGQSTLIGEVLVRYSKNRDFELIFSKGPGVNLLTLRQNDSAAEVRGVLARTGWSGPPDRAPKQLGGWLALREKIISAGDRKSVSYLSGSESFLFRF